MQQTRFAPKQQRQSFGSAIVSDFERILVANIVFRFSPCVNADYMTAKNPSHEERIAALEGASSAIPRRWFSFQNVVSVISIAVALFAVFRPEWRQESNSSLNRTIDQEIDHKLQEARISELTGEVKTMSGKLEEISGFLKIVVAKEMQNNSKLSPPDFEKRLPQVASTLEVAKIVHADTPPTILTDLQTRLLSANQGDAPFWLASSALVSLRSSIPGEKSLADCINSYTNTIIVTQPGTTTSFTGIPLYQDCTLNLDIPTPQKDQEESKRHVTGPDIACKRCRVIYSGGAIPSFRQGLRSIRFIDCSFEVSSSGVPPTDGREFLLALLRSTDAKLIEYKAMPT